MFFLCTPDPANGMLYIRAVPADQVEEIITSENDIQQELAYKPTKQGAPLWPAYSSVTRDTEARDTSFHASLCLQSARGRRMGRARPRPHAAMDWPLLRLAGRPGQRLNRFRFAWMIVWKRKWNSEAEKRQKSSELAANPPPSGSWLLLDENESVEMPAPNLEGSDAEKDGLALKKMIALGAGVPTHYLAEPESSTRTTAEAAGTPTFRGLEQTQTYFLDILTEIAVIAVKYRKAFDRRVNPDSHIEAVGPDITERDNSTLALAVSRVYPAF